MKINKCILTVGFLLYAGSFQMLHSQSDKGVLTLKGLVEEDREPLTHAKVLVYKDSREIKSLTTDNKGLFTLMMDLNEEYTIAFTKENYVTKKIFVNSELPDDIGGKWSVEFSIGLFKMYPGLDVSALDEPVTKIKYKKQEKGFGYNQNYTAMMMGKVDDIFAQLKRLKEKDYKTNIRKGDDHFDGEEYQESIQYYQKALDERPDERYPRKQVGRARELMKEYEKRQTFYMNAVARADALFKRKKYEDARETYYEALSYDQSKDYPNQQIEKIDQILRQRLAEAKSRKQKEEAQRYAQLISQADGAFEGERYTTARKHYRVASGLRPEEDYPRQRLDRIEENLQQQNREQAEYKRLITQGDAAFEQEEFTNAKALYTEALFMKPGEGYPKQRIELINDKLSNMKAQKQREEEQNKQYREAISTADQLFQLEEYEDARIVYNQALKVKPNEEYPGKKIADIDRILSGRVAKQEEAYKNALASGNQYMDRELYDKARSSYLKAREIKPEESYPNAQIKKIDELLAQKVRKKKEQERLMLLYKGEIEKADELFSEKTYYDATVHYKKALQYRPDEAYPREQIRKIEEIWEKLENNNKQASKTPSGNEKTDGPPDLNFSSVKEKRTYLSKLVLEYPKGVTVEHYDLGKRKIKRVILNYDSVATDYRRVKHSWGGTFYFRNGQTISRAVFNVETKERD